VVRGFEEKVGQEPIDIVEKEASRWRTTSDAQRKGTAHIRDENGSVSGSRLLHGYHGTQSLAEGVVIENVESGSAGQDAGLGEET
jgi:hypothetical protein